MSFRAVRPVENGPLGVIDALTRSLGPSGTLVMPAWSASDLEPFDPDTSPANPDLGATADLFWRQPGFVRSRHPFAFAARGPVAEAIIRDPIALPPHRYASLIGRMLDHGGKVLLLGVDHDANTTIHLAELMANVPYRRRKKITVGTGEAAALIDYTENDHCCQRFRFVGDWLDDKGAQNAANVGNSQAMLASSRAIVEAVVQRLTQDPFTFLHSRGSGCDECDDAWQSVSPH